MSTTHTGYHQRAGELLEHRWGMLIGGDIVPALGGETYEDTSSLDGRTLAVVPLAQAADAQRAVASASSAFGDWKRTPVAERAALLGDVVAVLRDHAEELAILDSLDSGNPAAAMIGDVHLACEWLDYARGVAMEVKGATLPAPRDHWLLTRREPYGVVLRITAYNHPILFAAQKIGAPLATGNTLILKIPQQTPLAPLRMGELLAGVLPPGVLNIVTGSGSVAGDALVRHPDIKRISLIGGVETGQRIQMAAAESGIKHVTLELGGKNPMIILPDADLERAAQGAVRGMNFAKTQGQSCGSCSRVFIHSDIHDAVLERIVQLCEEIRIGDPLDPQTQMGAMVSEREFARVMGYIESGQSEGARLMTGGARPEGLRGCFIAPTVFANVTMDMRIGCEEIFGPVLSVFSFDSVEEAFALADGVDLGLTASIWTRDLRAALDLADRLDTGYVWINGSATHFTGAPFSGHRNSGTDSEEGIEELLSFTQLKTIAIGLATG